MSIDQKPHLLADRAETGGREMTEKWAHDALAADLAAHFRGMSDRMVWCDMQLGPSGSERPDVYTMKKSYSRPEPSAYEIKISVSDFRSDITSGKWQKYYQESGAVTFCVPQGLITKEDIPKGVGLMIRTDAGWHTAKAPTRQRVEMSVSCLMKLLIDGLPRLKQNNNHSAYASEWDIARKLEKKIGHDVAQFIENKARAESQLEHLQEQQKKLRAAIRELEEREAQIMSDHREKALAGMDKELSYINHPLAELKIALGLPHTASQYDVSGALKDMAKFVSDDSRLNIATQTMKRVHDSIERSLDDLRPPAMKVIS